MAPIEGSTNNNSRLLRAIIGICKEDDPRDVDEAYGEGTYAACFPPEEEEETE